MNPFEYLHLQLGLEGKAVINGDLLRQVEIVPEEEMPLMIIARCTDDDIVAYYDEALQPELRKRLGKRIQDVVFPEVSPLLAFLRTQNISVDVDHYKTYIFPGHMQYTLDDVKCVSKHDLLIQAFGFGGFADSVYAIERDGKIVSACVSARENDRCGEAWVYTDEKYRHQGLAQRSVGMWSQDLIKAGKIPFYSHKIGNTASANLAKRLGVRPVFEEIVFSKLK